MEASSERKDSESRTRRTPLPLTGIVAALYGLLLIYGTLFPLSGWSPPESSPWLLLVRPPARPAGLADVLLNVGLYVPLGFTVAHLLLRRWRPVTALLTAVGAGAALSLTLEYFQAYLPWRTASWLDAVLNGAGTVIGAASAPWFSGGSRAGRWLSQMRRRYFSNAQGTLGLSILVVWAYSQAYPLVFSFSARNLRHGVEPFTEGFETSVLGALHVASTLLSIAGLGWIATRLPGPARLGPTGFGFFVGLVLALKIPVISRQLSLETLAGALLGCLLVLALRRVRERPALLAAACALAVHVVLGALRPLAGAELNPEFNWLPFRFHARFGLVGLAQSFGSIWPFLGLGFVGRRLAVRPAPKAGLVGGGMVACLVLLLEWGQRHVAGRYPDVTTVFLALIGWSLAWWVAGRPRSQKKAPIDILGGEGGWAIGAGRDPRSRP